MEWEYIYKWKKYCKHHNTDGTINLAESEQQLQYIGTRVTVLLADFPPTCVLGLNLPFLLETYSLDWNYVITKTATECLSILKYNLDRVFNKHSHQKVVETIQEENVSKEVLVMIRYKPFVSQMGKPTGHDTHYEVCSGR